jgi:hypothetical protein
VAVQASLSRGVPVRKDVAEEFIAPATAQHNPLEQLTNFNLRDMLNGVTGANGNQQNVQSNSGQNGQSEQHHFILTHTGNTHLQIVCHCSAT